MIYGGITCRGLVPNRAPIFVDQWLNAECAKIGKQWISMDRFLFFCERVTPAEQADKMADVWPIENIWHYIKQKLDACQIKDLVTLKTKIVEIWRTISSETCSTLIRSIPRRLQCVIDKKRMGN